MPKRQFEFSPPVQLILTNLPTIRHIQKIFDETIRQEVKQFLKHLAVRLQEAIPEVKTWQSEISDETLYVFPGKSWRVVKDDHIAVCLSMQQCIEPAFYNDEDDPFVGLYVPQWRHLQSFTNHLKGFRIPGFEYISDHEEMDDTYPLWSNVPLTPLVRRPNRLDLDGLEKAILQRVRKLVEKEDKITNLISKVQQKTV